MIVDFAGCPFVLPQAHDILLDGNGRDGHDLTSCNHLTGKPVMMSWRAPPTAPYTRTTRLECLSFQAIRAAQIPKRLAHEAIVDFVGHLFSLPRFNDMPRTNALPYGHITGTQAAAAARLWLPARLTASARTNSYEIPLAPPGGLSVICDVHQSAATGKPVIMPPVVFIHHALPSRRRYKCRRTLLRTELRESVNAKLVVEESAKEGAAMRWTPEHYAEDIVITLGLKFHNWPKTIPFANLSKIGGGVPVLEELLRRWYSQDPNIAIRLVPSTPEDRANAAADPLSVHPNRKLFKPPTPIFDSEPLTVYPLALHPGDLGPMGIHPTSTQPSAVTETLHGEPEKKTRQQRSDVKRHRGPRVKLLTAEGLPFVRPYPFPPKRGITSFRFVLPESSQVKLVGDLEDREGPGYVLVNDPIDEFLPDIAPRLRADGRSRSVLADDPIDEFLPEEIIGGGMEVDEIEDADGDWPGLRL
ncbi:hypothetical protein NUW54_g8406 [Trametes sanguinea]|uniref:Uncharacterized protein n=1 Tax=Trametes sanguinea TaxID=158606 RepID=A0ACC1PEM5_9APHY|nr:hypothetical protein NUW54_g8406 [Trametes sanguinea]